MIFSSVHGIPGQFVCYFRKLRNVGRLSTHPRTSFCYETTMKHCRAQLKVLSRATKSSRHPIDIPLN
jgi:hypothetical protein